MSGPLRFLVAEGEPPESRAARRRSTGRSSGETFVALLGHLAAGCQVDRAKPADGEGNWPEDRDLAGYDAVFLTGSPLHLYKETPQTRRQVEFMRAVFGSGTPAFGSCAGLQVATVAAGGTVRPMQHRESGFARRITPTAAGSGHPLLRGRPAAYDAPAVHTDEVASLPDGAVHLAENALCRVQAAEIRCGAGVFWGVQYHPEISLGEVAAALRRDSDTLLKEGLARDEADLEAHLALIDALGAEPSRRDLAWRLGLDSQVTDPGRRTLELQNFLRELVQPTKARRGR